MSSPAVVVAFLVALITAGPAEAAARATPAALCHKARLLAASKYDACVKAVLATVYGRWPHENPYLVSQAPFARCRTKYRAAWPRLARLFTGKGTACDQPRFVEVGPTVMDRLTGLEWEKKSTEVGSIHHLAGYTWSTLPPGSDGTVFTTFLATLNDPASCFAGACDWRLPTLGELQTIMVEQSSCQGTYCVDPVFGPAAGSWSSTVFLPDPTLAWFADFQMVFVNQSTMTDDGYVIAVRGGLD